MGPVGQLADSHSSPIRGGVIACHACPTASRTALARPCRACFSYRELGLFGPPSSVLRQGTICHIIFPLTSNVIRAWEYIGSTCTLHMFETIVGKGAKLHCRKEPTPREYQLGCLTQCRRRRICSQLNNYIITPTLETTKLPGL